MCCVHSMAHRSAIKGAKHGTGCRTDGAFWVKEDRCDGLGIASLPCRETCGKDTFLVTGSRSVFA